MTPANAKAEDDTPSDLRGTRTQAMQRLQVGIGGLAAMVLVVGLASTIMQQARQYPGQERQFFDFVRQNPQMQQQMRAPIFEDKVIDHIVENAQVTEKEISKEDLEKAVEALDEE